MSTYFKNIGRGMKTTMKGMSLTLKHFWNARRSRKPYAMQDPSYFDLQTGIVTLQYPHQTLPVPDNGRYQLDCEIDDCIVCDKCAKVCPVDCIDIEPIKSSEVISYTSDGSPVRLYAAKFDIDMAKCCFCGLCTTVCPTECLTMTNEYDFSVVDITDMNFEFSNLTAEQADKKRKLYEQFLAEKEELKKSSPSAAGGVPISSQQSAESTKPKPAFKPNFKPATKPVENTKSAVDSPQSAESTKPKPATKPVENIESVDSQQLAEIPKPKPAFKPSFKTATKPVENAENKEVKEEIKTEIPKPKPAFKPSFKTATKSVENKEVKEEIKTEIPKPKPAFKPSFKTATKPVENIESVNIEDEIKTETPKPAFKPSSKVESKEDKSTENHQEEDEQEQKIEKAKD